MPSRALLHSSPSALLRLATSVLLGCGTLGLTGLLLAPDATAQRGKRSTAEIEAEIEFAQGLAADWGFVDMAEEVVRALEKEVSGKSAERLGLVKCQLYGEAAKSERDPARRRELYDSAISAYDNFIKANAVSDRKEEAEASRVETAFTFARYIERDLEDAAGEEAEQLSNKMVEVLTSAISITEELVSGLKSIAEPQQEDKLQMYRLMLRRGQMYAMLAQQEPTGGFDSYAISSLEELVFAAGDGTPPALTAYKVIGDVYASKGQWSEASAYYESIILQTIPPNLQEWELRKKEFELGPGDVALFFRFVEMATPGVIEAYSALGDTPKACEFAMHFYNTWKREGVPLESAGYEALLAVARALLNSSAYVGGDMAKGFAKWYPTQEEMEAEVRNRRERSDTTSVAMELANTVNAENQGSYLQLRAQKVISEISQMPGVSVSPDLQLQAATGEYYDENYDKAVGMLRDLLADLDGAEEATRIQFGGKIFNLLGNAYRKQERTVEAALAFRTAIVQYEGADPEQNLTNAKAYNSMMRDFGRSVPNEDAVLKRWIKEAEDTLIRVSAESGDVDGPTAILWRRAEELYDKKEYDAAIAAYKEIPLEDTYGERAFVQIAVAKFRDRKIDESLALLEKYLTEIIEDPRYDSEMRSRQRAREGAVAVAEFFRGYGHYIKQDYRKVLDLIGDYHERFPDMSQFANWTLDIAMRSHLALGETKLARQAFDKMVELFPDTGRTAEAGISIYKELGRQVDDVQGPARIEHLTQMAELLKAAQDSGSAGYPELWNQALHWSDIADLQIAADKDPMESYSNALVPLQAIKKRFAGDPERQSDLKTKVLPKLGEVLNSLRLLTEANEILTPLVMGEKSSPNKQTVLNWVKSQSGWLEGGGAKGAITVIPGAGGTPESYQRAIDVLEAIGKSRDVDSYSCEWYEYKFMLAYTYFVWGKDDSSKKASSANQLAQLKASLIDGGWAMIEDACGDTDLTSATLRARLGDRVLQSRFEWLERQVN